MMLWRKLAQCSALTLSGGRRGEEDYRKKSTARTDSVAFFMNPWLLQSPAPTVAY